MSKAPKISKTQVDIWLHLDEGWAIYNSTHNVSCGWTAGALCRPPAQNIGQRAYPVRQATFKAMLKNGMIEEHVGDRPNPHCRIYGPGRAYPPRCQVV